MNEDLASLDAVSKAIHTAAVNGLFLSAIYGLFQGDHCIYVGCSTRPDRRVAHHKCRQLRGRFNRAVVFDVVLTLDGPMAEGRWIKFYRDRGEAEFNKQCWVAFNGRDLENPYKPAEPKPFTSEELRNRIAATLGIK